MHAFSTRARYPGFPADLNVGATFPSLADLNGDGLVVSHLGFAVDRYGFGAGESLARSPGLTLVTDWGV
jgi:hypothetical protein